MLQPSANLICVYGLVSSLSSQLLRFMNILSLRSESGEYLYAQIYLSNKGDSNCLQRPAATTQKFGWTNKLYLFKDIRICTNLIGDARLRGSNPITRSYMRAVPSRRSLLISSSLFSFLHVPKYYSYLHASLSLEPNYM